MARSSIELVPMAGHVSDSSTTRNASPTEDGIADTHTSSQEFSLPPVDGGKDAWFFLAAAFMLEALVWGKSLTTRHHKSTTTN
jgi:hypothetical protein